jgi:D-sedoheptulose 7-phosphate isomerase
MKDYTKDIRTYLNEEIKVLSQLDEQEISTVMNVLEETRLTGNRVFICGNGGSAATASHFTCDFNKGISYSQTVKYNFECLNDNIPMLMAIANDISYDDIFSEPLKNKMHKEDVLLAISGSGNSKNVVKAVEYAKSIGATTIGLVGYSGGKVKELCDYCIHVNIDNMQIVEDVHMVMDHVMMFVLSGMKGANG